MKPQKQGCDRLARAVLPVSWRFDEWTMAMNRRLAVEANLRSARTPRSGADSMDATEVRRLLGFLIRIEDIVVSAALESTRMFDDVALDADGIGLGLLFEEVHITRDAGSIEIHVSVRARVARRMIFGRRRRLLRESGATGTVDPSEPTASEYTAVLSPVFLPNAASVLASMPSHLMVDRVVDAALHDYEMAVALRDPERREDQLSALHNVAWHAAPSRRRQ